MLDWGVTIKCWMSQQSGQGEDEGVGVAIAWVQQVHFVHPGAGRVSGPLVFPVPSTAVTRCPTSCAVTALALARHCRCLGGIIKKGHMSSPSWTTPTVGGGRCKKGEVKMPFFIPTLGHIGNPLEKLPLSASGCSVLNHLPVCIELTVFPYPISLPQCCKHPPPHRHLLCNKYLQVLHRLRTE